jgi:hypothetical protein
MPLDKNATGKDSYVRLNGQRYTVINKDTSTSVDTATTDYDDRLEQSTTETSLGHEVTLEVEGRYPEIERAAFRPNGAPRDGVVVQLGDGQNADRYTECTPTDLEKGYPSDGRQTVNLTITSDKKRPA